MSVDPETKHTTTPTHEGAPPPHSRLLQRYRDRKQEPPPQVIDDLAISRLTYVGKDDLSRSGSQPPSLVGEEYRAIEPIPPSTSKLQVTFSESHVRKYKPGSATLLEPGELIEKIRDACWDHFGPVAPNDTDAQPTEDHEAIESRQDVQVFSVEDDKDLRDTIMSMAPVLPEAKGAPTRDTPSAEPEAAFAMPQSDPLENVYEDIPQEPALPPGTIVERDIEKDKRTLATIVVSATLHNAEFERTMHEDHKGSHSACCSGCTVS
jgi:hypothetical protein